MLSHDQWRSENIVGHKVFPAQAQPGESTVFCVVYGILVLREYM